MAQSKEYYLAYYERNKERIAERIRKYREANREQVNESTRRSRRKNREHVNEYNRTWQQKRRDERHPQYLASYRNKSPELKARIMKKWRESEKGRAYLQRYKVEKKELLLRLWRLRSARRVNAEGTYTVAEWEEMKKNYRFTCPCCLRKEPEIKLTLDHIVPLSRGGKNSIDNFQPLCGSCNSRKRTKIIRYNVPYAVH